MVASGNMDRKRTSCRARFRAVVPWGLALAGVGIMVAPAAGQEEEFRVEGSDVAVYNLAGQVRILAGSGPDVTVLVSRRGDDAGQLRVETGDLGGRATLRVIYPDDRIVYPGMGRGSSTDMRVRSDGTFGHGGRGGDRVRISGSGGGLEAWADMTIRVPRGRSLSVYLGAGESEAEGVEGNLRIDTGSGRVSASRIAGSLLVDTGSGSVEVLDVDGDVTVDTGSGSVRVSDVRGERLAVDTGSGSVSGRGFTVGSLNVDTGSGSVDLDEIASADVYVDTGSGSVELGLLRDVDELLVDTGSGGVTLVVPEDMGAEVEIETGSGGIDVDLPVQIRSMRRSYMRGTLGDGAGRIVIDTGSGGVRIVRR